MKNDGFGKECARLPSITHNGILVDRPNKDLDIQLHGNNAPPLPSIRPDGVLIEHKEQIVNKVNVEITHKAPSIINNSANNLVFVLHQEYMLPLKAQSSAELKPNSDVKIKSKRQKRWDFKSYDPNYRRRSYTAGVVPAQNPTDVQSSTILRNPNFTSHTPSSLKKIFDNKDKDRYSPYIPSQPRVSDYQRWESKMSEGYNDKTNQRE